MTRQERDLRLAMLEKAYRARAMHPAGQAWSPHQKVEDERNADALRAALEALR